MDVLPHNRLSPLLSQQHLPFLASGGLLRRPPVAAQRHAYSTKDDSSVRPIGRYPVPNKKDMPYDIVELMEEVEVKVNALMQKFCQWQTSTDIRCRRPVLGHLDT